MTLGSFKTDDCGMQSVGITYNPTARDWNAAPQISEWVWSNTDENAKYYFRPNDGHRENNEHSCGPAYFCDSLYQMWLRDLDGTLGAGGGAIIPVNPGFALASPGCEDKGSDFNAFSCPGLKPRLFQWESADPDCCGWDKRILGKFKIERHSDRRSWWARGMFDNTCKCQFGDVFMPFSIQPSETYDMTIFATMPKKSRIFFFSDDPEEYALMQIFYQQPLKIRPYINGNFDAMAERAVIPRTNDVHGAHAQNPQERRFYILMRGQPGGMTNGNSIFFRRLRS
jgi:hypothetical protein